MRIFRKPAYKNLILYTFVSICLSLAFIGCKKAQQCACKTIDACCNGCQPLNETGNCDDQSACTEQDKCVAGVCVGKAKKNGISCDLTGNKGVCVDGACKALSSCDARKYAQAANFACNLDAECSSGKCLEWGDDWNTYCTQACGGSQPACPSGMKCVDRGALLGFICMPEDIEGTLPGDGSYDTFDVCNNNADCAGDLCLSLSGMKFCSKDCTKPSGGGDDSLCGSCGSCHDGGFTYGLPFDYFCVPKGSQERDGACGYNFDCLDGVCFNNACTENCWTITDTIDTCPDGYTCILGAMNDTQGVCVKAESVGTASFGEDCKADHECTSKRCQEIGGKKICVTDCTLSACAEGSCVNTGPEPVNTAISLWKEGGSQALYTNDDGGEGKFSKLAYTVTEAGTYYAEVYGSAKFSDGYYYLTITNPSSPSPAAPDFPRASESEPNETMATATPVTYPVKVLGHLDREGHDFFSFSVAVSRQLELRLETSAVDRKSCVPGTQVATRTYGENCQLSLECPTDYDCHRNICTKACTSDADCPNGTCISYGYQANYCLPQSMNGSLDNGRNCALDFECTGSCYHDPDNQENYCTSTCTSDGDCSSGMGCQNGLCVKALATLRFPYATCRINADCDSGLCVDGLCSSACQNAQECEGGSAYTPVQYGTCWPCAQDADCNAGGSGPNRCVTANQTDYYCGTDCTTNPGVCPANTRCYAISASASICFPVSFDCAGGVKCTSGGHCLLPRLVRGQPCKDDIECKSGTCRNGLCSEGTCSANGDCNCDFYKCEGTYCAVSVGENTAEVEPNDRPSSAQALTGFPAVIVGSFMPKEGAPDVDVYKVSLQAGQGLDLRTRAFCNIGFDTYVRLLDSFGNVIPGWENDDINPYGDYFSYLSNYVAQSNQDVLIEVSQSPYVSSPTRVHYLMDVNVYNMAANNICSGAQAITAGTHNLTMAGATNNYSADSCTSYVAGGPDLVYSVTVPPNHLLSASITTPFDAQLYLVANCADTEGTCLTGSDRAMTNGTESLMFANMAGLARFLYLIVDSFPPLASPAFTMTVSFDELTRPVNDVAANAIPVSSNGEISGKTWGAANDYNPGALGCSGKELPGPDVVYSISMGEKQFVKVVASASSTDYPFNAELYLVTNAADLSTCVAYGAKSLYYANQGAAQTYYLIVDSAAADANGPFKLNFTFGTLGDCGGACTASSHTNSCIQVTSPSDTLCTCNGSTSLLNPVDCNQACIDAGALSGVCAFINYSGGVDNCLCTYDCTTPSAQCSANRYTNCTCATSDPCGWKGDNQCDAYCAAVYPNDHFDDSADCAP